MNGRERQVVIMAGGVGSRFWPLSTSLYPKQFIDVMGVGKSLLQMTVERFLPLCPMKNFWVVTSEKYVDIVKLQLPDLPETNILSEPQPRNTAPCIGYACWKIQKKYPDANIVITPSDALVINTTEFQRILTNALDYTENNSSIVTIGIKPNRPETGYGYICTEVPSVEGTVVKVESFKEKPDLELAKTYVQSSNYLWNAGIFVWNIQTITQALREFTPDLAGIMDQMAADFYTEKEGETVKRLFPTCERISIDYAVMEKSPNIYTIPADFGWSDLGSWGALHSLLPKDVGNNASVGERVKLVNCHNCMVHASQDIQMVLEGLDGYIISENQGKFLVCRMTEEQKIKDFANV